MKKTKRVISIRIDDDLLNAVDYAAAGCGQTRSDFISTVLHADNTVGAILLAKIKEIEPEVEDRGWTHCRVCGVKLTRENTHPRLDAFGHKWCVNCSDEYDAIDWDAITEDEA